MSKHKKYLIFDMDGTLFRWNPDATLRELGSREYYENCPAYEEMKKLLYSLKDIGKLYICSCYVNEEALKGKNAALDKQFPGLFPKERRIFVPYGNSKPEYASAFLKRQLNEDVILFDDHSPNLLEWEEHGGKAVKVLNGINGSGKIWKGMRMTLDGHLIPRKTSIPLGDDLISARYQCLAFAVIRQAVEDYQQAGKKETDNSETVKSRVISFLDRDDFGFGTQSLLRQIL